MFPSFVYFRLWNYSHDLTSSDVRLPDTLTSWRGLGTKWYHMTSLGFRSRVVYLSAKFSAEMKKHYVLHSPKRIRASLKKTRLLENAKYFPTNISNSMHRCHIGLMSTGSKDICCPFIYLSLLDCVIYFYFVPHLSLFLRLRATKCMSNRLFRMYIPPSFIWKGEGVEGVAL